jgi:hypothetical protein
VRKNFFTQWIISDWKIISMTGKNSKNVQEIKKNYTKYTTTDGGL